MEYEERKLKAINELMLIAKGSLWFIKDSIWQQTIKDFVKQRVGHVGLVYKNMSFSSLNDTVPVLIGTSFGSGLKLRPVLPRYRKKRAHTVFSIIRPISTIPENTPPLAVDKFTGYDPNIKVNEQKPFIDEDEYSKLDQYLAQKGLNV